MNGSRKCDIYITMEYYLALKGKEMLTHIITWMNLEDIMPSEMSQLEKTYIM